MNKRPTGFDSHRVPLYRHFMESCVNPSECYAIVECLKNSDFHNLTPGHDHNNIA